MKTFCVKCRKNTENFNSTVFKTKIGRLIMQSKRANCGIKKPRFVKEQEAKGLLSNLWIKTPLSKIPLLKSSGRGIDNEPNYQLASELHRKIIRKFKKPKVY